MAASSVPSWVARRPWLIRDCSNSALQASSQVRLNAACISASALPLAYDQSRVCQTLIHAGSGLPLWNSRSRPMSVLAFS